MRIITIISIIFLLILISGCQRSLGDATLAILIPCEDSDNGLDYFHSGQAIYKNEIYKDQCLDEKTLAEVYCVNDRYLRAESYTCPFQCLNGKCMTE